MASDTASFKPTAFHLELYAGDGAAVRLTITNGSEAPLPLTGEVAAQIRKERPSTTVLADLGVNMTEADDGIVVLTLDGEQTQALMDCARPKDGVFYGQWDCEWRAPEVPPVTLLSGRVRCDPDVTRPADA